VFDGTGVIGDDRRNPQWGALMSKRGGRYYQQHSEGDRPRRWGLIQIPPCEIENGIEKQCKHYDRCKTKELACPLFFFYVAKSTTGLSRGGMQRLADKGLLREPSRAWFMEIYKDVNYEDDKRWSENRS
jgi:hypothetical protein